MRFKKEMFCITADEENDKTKVWKIIPVSRLLLNLTNDAIIFIKFTIHTLKKLLAITPNFSENHRKERYECNCFTYIYTT